MIKKGLNRKPVSVKTVYFLPFTFILSLLHSHLALCICDARLTPALTPPPPPTPNSFKTHPPPLCLYSLGECI
jgi:hypothetical protein